MATEQIVAADKLASLHLSNLAAEFIRESSMSRPKLCESWAVTLRHLAASRFYLPEQLESVDATACWSQMQRYLHHNELGLAFEEAMALGDLSRAPAEYWRELQLAATNMEAPEQLALIATRL